MNVCHLIDNMTYMATLPDNAFDQLFEPAELTAQYHQEEL